ncbi:hypothetical protein QEH59_01190 [Coraliomargarita sp. SDUM461004]|uniref:Alpha-L-arabinofuranosidase 1 catalytic domain-containing protein n=1 Tax=Thalassobacterium sedimentorum TaxID=3041258 RepID=A0ABU1AE90_9BACT|nr:hypothetical protein [Coraliomargarita sp. SDUM461004]MDQ8193020.1 hypothetical protein [Coraliomargarita sp. SDUM461004]
MSAKYILFFLFSLSSVSVSNATGFTLLNKDKIIPPASVEVIEASGQAAASDLEAIADGDLELGSRSVLTGEEDGKGYLKIALDRPHIVQAVRYLARATKDVGKENDLSKFSLHKSSDDSVLYAGNFHGSSPKVFFPPVIADEFHLRFEQLKWNPNNQPLNIAELSFFEPAWQVTVDGETTTVLSDNLRDESLSLKLPCAIDIQLPEATTINGVAWAESLKGSGIKATVQVDGVATTALKTDAAWRSLHFSPTQGREVKITFTGEAGATLSLSEIDLYTPAVDSSPQPVSVRFPDQSLGEIINPLVYGGNIEYWIDDDAILGDPEFVELVRETPMPMLRFPGGTESDRYLWREHKLYDSTQWPYIDGPETTDTDEFIRFCRAVGAEPIICVNTEYAFYENDIQKGAQYAADWVRYCKDNDYQVKYWTIGNEMYWRLAFTVEEYTELVIAYAEAMRAVDPDILIAVPGEVQLNSVAKKDKPTAEGLQIMLETERKRRAFEITPKQNVEIQNRLMREYRNPDALKWWPNLLQGVKDHIDMIEVHLYAGSVEKAFMLEDGYAKQLADLKRYAREVTGKDIMLGVTEWNTSIWWGEGKDALGMEQALYIGEMLGALIEGGTDFANFWPITMEGQWIAKALYVEDHHNVLPSYYTFSAMARHLLGHRLPVEIDNSDLYSIASMSESKDRVTLIVMSRPTRAQGPVALTVPLGEGVLAGMSPTSVQVISAPAKRSYAIETTYPAWDSIDDESLTLSLPQYAFTIIQFSRP